jgi:mRNA interferase MazF
MEVKRGDVVTAVLPKELGKPRPALVVQADAFNANHPTVTLLPITSEIRDAPIMRVTLEPTDTNGLKHISQVMVDKATSPLREKISSPIGHLSDAEILRIDRALLVWLGLV